jgi:glyoxylase-like metal-dependent hydrolase (beta-lactamase superfamily II)
VLVETGMGTPAIQRPKEWLGGKFLRTSRPVLDDEQTAATQIRKLGFAAEDVRHIVLTHLDLDHAGGIVDFPHAEIHVYAEELDAAEHPRNKFERARYRSVQFAHHPKWSTYRDLGESWFGFDAVRELNGLPPEILLVPLAGHTRGHAGVAVDTGDGWLLHAGDSYFFHGEMDPAKPHCPPGLAMFEAKVQTVKHQRLHNQRRLRQLLRDHSGELTAFSSHDRVEFQRLSQKSRV